jgi:GAF domain-containing protein
MSRKPAKTRHGETTKPKGNNAPTATRRRSSTIANLQEQVTFLTRELAEAREQQTATSQVLQVISSSPGQIEPVFDAMLANATRVCEAAFGVLYLFEGDSFRAVALHGPAAFVEARRHNPILPIIPGTALGRVAATKQTAQIADVQAEPAYRSSPAHQIGRETGGLRTVLSVPMLKEGELIGTFNLFRQEVRPFTDKQIELVKNFAAQAVIAIENTRLLNELRQRTDDLSESLDQQTATSEVLRAISSSPGELEPVFNVMLANATKLCTASFGTLWLKEGDAFRAGALYGELPAPFMQQWQSGSLIRPHPDAPMIRALASRKTIEVADLRQTRAYRNGDPLVVAGADVAGIRTMIAVPMFKDNEPVGAISIYRKEVHPFSDKQIALVTNFAAQAVIAIENTRLLNELRESLQQQTATADVLKVISSSPGALTPVFDAMLQNAVSICEAKFGVMFRFDGDVAYAVAMLNLPPALDEYLRQRGRRQPAPGSDLEQVLKLKQVIHTIDLLETPNPIPPARLAGARTCITVPMLKEAELVGAIVIYRQDVRSFTDKQIELVQNFAAQAVIAIENVRLLNELRESLQQQTATADVLKVISSSPGDLKPVFQAVLENATRLCEANFGILTVFEEDDARVVAMHGAPPAFQELRRREPNVPAAVKHLLRTNQTVHMADLTTVEPYASTALVSLAGARSFVAVPLLKESEPIGNFSIYRQEVRPFTDKQIALVQNFAAQAVIAIDNTRLLNELRQKNNGPERISGAANSYIGGAGSHLWLTG